MGNIYDCIIIGGGISGVSFASYASKKYNNILLFEKNEKLGGVIDSFYFGDDFWIEMGAHTCYNSYTTLLSSVSDNSFTNKILSRHKKKYKFLKNNRLQRITKQVKWRELIFSLPKMRKLSKKGLDVETYYSKILGKKNYHNFAKKFFAAVICQKADRYPAELFLKRRNTRNKEFPKSFSFKNGMQNMINELSKNFEIICNSEVNIITSQENLFFVSTKDNKNYKSKNIVLATHPIVASILTNSISKPISEILNKIKMTKVFSICVIINKKDLELFEFAGIIPNDESFLSVVSRDILPHPTLRGFCFHFDTNKTDKKDGIEIIQKVLKVDKSKFLTINSKTIILPKLTIEHSEIFNQLNVELSKTKHLYLTGNYFGGLSIEDCFIRSKEEYKRMLSENLN